MLVKKIIKRLNSENGTIVVKNADELRNALKNYQTVVVSGKILCGAETITLREGQKLMGIEKFLNSSEIVQHRILNYASGLVFEFNANGSGVHMAEGCCLSDLWIAITIGEKGVAGSSGAVCLGSGKHFFIHNLNVIVDTSTCCNSGYFGGITTQVQDGICELSGNISIMEKYAGRRTCGIIGGVESWGRNSFLLSENSRLEIDTISEGGHGLAYANVKASKNAALKIHIAAYNTAAVYNSEVSVEDNAKFDVFSNGHIMSCSQLFANGEAKIELRSGKKARGVLVKSMLKCYGKAKIDAVIAGKEDVFLQGTTIFLYGCTSFHAEILDKKRKAFDGATRIRIDDGTTMLIKVPEATELKVAAMDIIKAVDAEDYSSKFKREDAAEKVKEILMVKRFYQSFKMIFH